MSSSGFGNCGTGILARNETGPNTQLLSVTGSFLLGCSTGLRVENGAIHAFRVQVNGGDIGGHIARTENRTQPPYLEIGEARMSDNTIGVKVEDGSFLGSALEIVGREVTPRPSDWGIVMTGGRMFMLFSMIRFQRLGGIEVAPDPPGAAEGLAIRLDYTRILGGERGLYAHGPASSSSCSLEMNGSIFSDQTVSALGWGLNPCAVQVDRESQLSVVSGFALEDLRTGVSGPIPVIQASGVLLNGRRYSGQLVEGPVEVAPDYRILSAGARIQF